MISKIGKIGVLMGGSSSERDISLKSGKAVCRALEKRGFEVFPLDIRERTASKIKKAKISLAFIALHGKFGEDGTIQGICESLRIPYTGSGVMASYLCLDKIVSRRIFRHYSIPVPEFEVFRRGKDDSTFRSNLSYPLVVKPSIEGSSIGITFVDSVKGLKSGLKEAFRYDDTAIVEKYIPGREITVGILDDRPLPVVEIVPKKRFFDFQAKYEKGQSEYVVPAPISRAQYERAQEFALLAHRVLGCRGFSRVDMILCGSTPYVLEVNSIPGLTETSLLPMAAKAKGISFEQLCVKIMQSAMKGCAYARL